MWRIYSPNPGTKSGVKVRTTIRKLFENFSAATCNTPYLQFFVGLVEYLEEAEICRLMGTLTFADVMLGGQGDRFAKLLCMKRTAFSHEAELRLLFQDINPKQGRSGVFQFPLDTNLIFEDVVLDPRLKDSDVAALEVHLRSAGCTLPISRSPLYQSPHFVIRAS